MVTSTRAAFLFLVLSGPTHCIAMSAKRKGKAGKGGKAPKGYDCESDGVSNIIMFGDSLVDVGNVNFSPVCQQGDIFCGDRQSNGPLVAEFIADKLCINVTASQSPTAIGGTGNNFAVTEARAGSADDGNDFEAQVTNTSGYLTFLAAAQNTTTPVVPPETLFFIWFGANDIRDALRELPSEAAAGAVITAAIAAIRSNIVSLIDAGACSFLVLGTLNIALAPIVRLSAQVQGANLGFDGVALEAFIAGVVAAARQFSLLFNTQLEAMLQGITITDSEGCLGIKYVDTFALLEDEVLSSDAYESKFGVFDPNSNITDLVCNFRYNDPETGLPLRPDGLPVLTEDEIDFECENFPFYDELHPATDLYELIADSFLDEVEDFAKGGTRLLRRGL